ncbi:hypothetical protein BC834DRAFT_825150 [Gloeopeniophorella convolvens]|nr:hypothetical protein BC834DRAFT_825150 [Gloeopeniophorella convolvens]
MDAAAFANPTATSDVPPAPPAASTSAAAHDTMLDHDRDSDDDGPGSAGGKKRGSKGAKRRKVNHACLYCRRSHMTCDEGRPCQRCIKREIGHLCHDENRPNKPGTPQAGPVAAGAGAPTAVPQMSIPRASVRHCSPSSTNWPGFAGAQNAYMYPVETFGREFSSLSDFLETLDEQAFFTGGGVSGSDAFGNAEIEVPGAMPPPAAGGGSGGGGGGGGGDSDSTPPEPATFPGPPAQPQVNDILQRYVDLVPPVLPSASMTEKFLLTAADPEPGTRDERLRRVIRTKYEAGLLKPYNYVKGYARLSRWMDRNVSQDSKQQILQPLSVLRPKFRAIAQSLRDLDLVFIEEAFERLMLDYDRVFSCMGIPACLWRRTGEIYKGNREFAELVGVDGYMLRDGRLCIYELMAEESAVNYWEKYGNVAFDSTQKAVLTSCVLRFKPAITHGSGAATPGRAVLGTSPSEDGFINCCFSFTIRRDTWGIPLMIVGNFIRC